MPHNFPPTKTDPVALTFLWITNFSSGIARLPFRYQHANHGASRCHPGSLGNCRKRTTATRELPVTILTQAAGLCFASSGGRRDLTKQNKTPLRPNTANYHFLLCCPVSKADTSLVPLGLKVSSNRHTHTHSNNKHTGWFQNGCIGF